MIGCMHQGRAGVPPQHLDLPGQFRGSRADRLDDTSRHDRSFVRRDALCHRGRGEQFCIRQVPDVDDAEQRILAGAIGSSPTQSRDGLG